MSVYSDLLRNYNLTQQASSDQRPSDVGSDTYAQDTRAWLARQEWSDYQTRFQPVEQQLIDTVTNTDLLDQRLAAIKVNTGQASTAAQQAAQQTQARYGVQPDAPQAQQQGIQSQLAGTASAVDAANSTRAAVYDRNMQVLSGSGRPAISSTGA